MIDLTAITVLTLILMGLCGVGIIGLVVFMFASEGLFPFRRLRKKDTSKCVVDITPISVKIVPASKHHVANEIGDTTTAMGHGLEAQESGSEAEAQSHLSERTEHTRAYAGELAEQSTQSSLQLDQDHQPKRQQ